jgi:hypothetical protein
MLTCVNQHKQFISLNTRLVFQLLYEGLEVKSICELNAKVPKNFNADFFLKVLFSSFADRRFLSIRRMDLLDYSLSVMVLNRFSFKSSDEVISKDIDGSGINDI